MKLKYVPGLAFVATVIIVVLGAVVEAKPATDINKLPRITVDTLYEPKVEEDTETSESSFIRSMILGTQAFQKTIHPRQEATYVTLFRLPWRIARSISQTGFGMAKGFIDAFSDQFMETYKHMQKNVIPQASESFAVWANPPKPNLATPWLDGGV